MAAANITKTVFNYNGEIPVVFSFTKVTQADWTVFGDYPGVINCRGTLYTGADEATLTYGTAAINNSGTAYTATSTSIVVGTAIITRVPPYYVLTTSGEIMMVLSETAADNAASTWTVKRACLGTTASATGVAHTNTVYILNIVIWGAATTGTVIGKFTPMPEQPSASLFGTTGA
jgi:hypothetical protein